MSFIYNPANSTILDVAYDITDVTRSDGGAVIPFSDDVIMNIDLSVPSSVLLSGGDVNAIADISEANAASGLNVRQFNPSAQPRYGPETLNGFTVVEYQEDDTLERNMTPTVNTTQNSQGCFLLVKTTGNAAGSSFFNENIYGLATATNLTLASDDVNARFFFQETFTGGGVASNLTGLKLDEWYVLSSSTVPGETDQTAIYINGKFQRTLTHAIDIPANVFGGPRLDKTSGSPVGYDDFLAHYIYYNRSLSNNEHAIVYNYLRSKWNINNSSSLPFAGDVYLDFDAAERASLEIDSANVNVINFRSSFSKNSLYEMIQNTPADRPNYVLADRNGLNVLQFTAADDELLDGPVVLSDIDQSNASLVTVVKGSPTVGGLLSFTMEWDANNLIELDLNCAPSVCQGQILTRINGETRIQIISVADNDYMMLTVTRRSGPGSPIYDLYVNNVLAVSNLHTQSFVATGEPSVSLKGADNMCAAQAIAYERVLSAADVGTIWTNLSNKWALIGNFPPP